MRLKNIIDTDIVNYKKINMTLEFAICTLKCDELNGCHVCQNSPLLFQPDIDIENEEIIRRYMGNKLTHAVVCAGLEPLDQFAELLDFIKVFRRVSLDEIIIYTGYTMDELETMGCIEKLKQFSNIIVKVGRFVMNCESHEDPLLGVMLASPNQYAVRIS